MNIFKCKHPFQALQVQKPETRSEDADFETVTVHLSCGKCGEALELSYANFIGGVDRFLGAAVPKATGGAA